MRMRKPTIGSHLANGLEMNMKSVPYGRQILIYTPEEADIDSSMSAREVLEYLKSNGFESYLKITLEDLVLADEQKKTRQIARFAFYTGLIGSFIALVGIVMTGYLTKEYPHWALLAPPLIIPGFIMWKQVGLFNAENARGIAAILSNIVPWGRNGNSSRGYNDDYEDYDDYSRPSRRNSYRDDSRREETEDVAQDSKEETKSSTQPTNGNPF